MKRDTDVRELLQEMSAEVGPLRTNPDMVVRRAHARLLRTGAIAAVTVVVVLVGGLAGAHSLRGSQRETPVSRPCFSAKAHSLAAKVAADQKVIKLGSNGSNLTALSLELETTADDVHGLAAAISSADAPDAALLTESANAYDAAGRAITDGLWGEWEGHLKVASRRLAEAEKGIAASKVGTC